MTESEWLVCHDPKAMLRFLGGRMCPRKIYLTAAAFLRRFWHLIPDDRSRKAVEAMELYADGRISWHALRRRQGPAKRAFDDLYREEHSKGVLQGSFCSGRLAVAWYASGMDSRCAAQHPSPELRVKQAPPWLEMFDLGAAPTHYASEEFDYSGDSSSLRLCRAIPPRRLFDVPESVREADQAVTVAECAAQAVLLRDLFQPFRAIRIEPGWLTSNDRAAFRIAEGIYQERAFERMPILADALEEAGCTDGGLLSHLRGPGPHALGCHVLDALLEKQ